MFWILKIILFIIWRSTAIAFQVWIIISCSLNECETLIINSSEKLHEHIKLKTTITIIREILFDQWVPETSVHLGRYVIVRTFFVYLILLVYGELYVAHARYNIFNK